MTTQHENETPRGTITSLRELPQQAAPPQELWAGIASRIALEPHQFAVQRLEALACFRDEVAQNLVHSLSLISAAAVPTEGWRQTHKRVEWRCYL